MTATSARRPEDRPLLRSRGSAQNAARRKGAIGHGRGNPARVDAGADRHVSRGIAAALNRRRRHWREGRHHERRQRSGGAEGAGVCYKTSARLLYRRFKTTRRILALCLRAGLRGDRLSSRRSLVSSPGCDVGVRGPFSKASCLVPGSRDAKLSREVEEALWQSFFTAAPAQRREFVPNSKRRKKRRARLPGATG